jgi:hypothetical protein
VTSAVVVAFRDGGLRPDDRQRLNDLARKLDASGLPRAGAVVPPRYSEDGNAAVLVTALRDGGEDQVVEAAETIREAAAAVERPARRSR